MDRIDEGHKRADAINDRVSDVLSRLVAVERVVCAIIVELYGHEDNAPPSVREVPNFRFRREG